MKLTNHLLLIIDKLQGLNSKELKPSQIIGTGFNKPREIAFKHLLDEALYIGKLLNQYGDKDKETLETIIEKGYFKINKTE